MAKTLSHKKNAYKGTFAYIYHKHYSQSHRHSSQNGLLRDCLLSIKQLHTKDLKSHYGCVNALEFSSDGAWIASGGDDRRVLLWNVQKTLQPGDCKHQTCLSGQHNSNIFCLAFNSSNEKILSGGNDEQVLMHDAASGTLVDVFQHEKAIYALSCDPINENVFASASDNGEVLVVDTRAPPSEDPFSLVKLSSPMHSVTFHPTEPRMVITANSTQGIQLWDLRHPNSCLLRYGDKQGAMSIRLDRRGRRLLALRRRMLPVMFDVRSTAPLCHFDHVGYYNSCTMKSCCFAGDDDQYILSGSDDFNVYMWKIPDQLTEANCYVEEASMILKGHRSIVNQVRFNPESHLVISSGVEKMIKLWSVLPLPGVANPEDHSERPVYSHEQYINLVLRSGRVMSHDYSARSTDEDLRMMAFFDSLVQREVEGWSSDESDVTLSPVRVSGSLTPQVDSLSSDADYSPFTRAFVSVITSSSDGLQWLGNGDAATDHANDDLETSGSSSQQPQRSISSLIANKRRQQKHEAGLNAVSKPSTGSQSVSGVTATEQNTDLDQTQCRCTQLDTATDANTNQRENGRTVCDVCSQRTTNADSGARTLPTPQTSQTPNTSTGSAADGHITWKQFKRFKTRTERALRQYRRRNEQIDASSGEEES